ncbi:MAG: hypothetical protein K6F09_01145 [Clostridiales bacterium]|nr:hypothetical protein [Clostridiales bacterium]
MDKQKKKRSTDKRSLAVRIIAIIMAVLMLLGILTMIITNVFAAELPPTGSSHSTTTIPILIAVGAAVLITLCVALPKLKKK